MTDSSLPWWCSPANHPALSRQGPGFKSRPGHFLFSLRVLHNLISLNDVCLRMKRYTFRNYLAYLRDNPKGYWFKRKLYGWGWAPASWQGWLLTLVFLLVVFADAGWVASSVPSFRSLAIFYAVLVVSIALLIVVCFKTGERPKWSWGR